MNMGSLAQMQQQTYQVLPYPLDPSPNTLLGCPRVNPRPTGFQGEASPIIFYREQA